MPAQTRVDVGKVIQQRGVKWDSQIHDGSLP